MADPTIPAGTSPVQTATQQTSTQSTSSVQLPPQTGSSSAQSLQLPATSIIPGLARDIKVGDVINFVMRGRSPDGLGLLYMMGQLVKASVPEHLEVGDRVQAKIERSGQKLLFKIMEVQSKHNETGFHAEPLLQNLSISAPEKLERQIYELLVKLSPYLPDQTLQTHAPIKELTSNLELIRAQTPPEVQQILSDLQKIFICDKALTHGQNIFSAIKNRFSSQSISQLKDILNRLETIIQKETGSPELRFFAKTLESLKDLSSNIDDKNPSAGDKVRRDLEKLLKVLILESETESIGKTPKKNFAYFNAIKIATTDLTALLQSDEPISKTALEKVMNTISQLQPNAKAITTHSQFGTDGLRDLIQLSGNLEQFVNTITMLNQLEPMMGLLQAPELILFPFIFQGLFSCGEFAIDPNAHKKKQSQKNTKEESEKQQSADKLYRYTASIQLPNLGIIHISSLQEDKKIDIQINVEDSEKGNFIMSKISDLKTELLSHGVVLRNMSADAIDISNEIIIES